MENDVTKEVGYFWWRHEPIAEGEIAPATAVAGELTVTAEGQIRLDLHGFLPSDDHPMSRMLGGTGEAVPDIQGRLKSRSEHVLLNDVFTLGGRAAFGGISYESYGADICLIGTNPFPQVEDELAFDGLSIPLAGYEDWLCLSSIETYRTKQTLKLKHKMKRSISYALDGGGALSLDFDLFGPVFGKVVRHSVEVKEEFSLTYLPGKKTSVKALRKAYLSISDLFLVLTSSDYSMEWPFIRLGRTAKSSHKYKAFFPRPRSTAPSPMRHDCWLTFPAIQEDFAILFQQWQRKRDELGPGMNLYLGTRRGVELYVEHRFVNLVWGLESLHRTVTQGKPPTPLELKVERIIAQVQKSSDRTWLRKKLEHSAEPSLAERLFECMSTLPLDFNQKVLRDFCKECADRRNDISHFGGQRSPGGYEAFVQKVYNLNNALTNLYPAILLKQCGVGDELLLNIFSRGRMASRIKYSLEQVGLRIIPTSKSEATLE